MAGYFPGVMDKDRFPDPFQIVHQDMVDYPVFKIRGKNFSEFRPGGDKADRTGWTIGATVKLIFQRQEVLFLTRLKAEGVYGVPLVLSAKKILPVNILKGEHKRGSFSGTNSPRVVVVVLIVVVLVAVVEIEVPRIVWIGAILRTRPVVVGLHLVYPLMAENMSRPFSRESLGYPCLHPHARHAGKRGRRTMI